MTRVTVKVLLNELLFSVEDSLKYNKASTENNLVLLWVLRLIFSWPIVTNYLFVFFFLFFFSDKTTVQWYFIVGPSLAVTVLAFIILYLRKRRIAGIYTWANKFFCILNASSQWKTPDMHFFYRDYKKQHNLLFARNIRFERRNLIIVFWH